MKVSIIIPVYNVEKYIARCLDSVINQTHQDLEIIVVNDATLDNSMAIVEEYAARDTRIRIVHNPRNMGLMMTRKNGYKEAKGDYLAFVDSDDSLPLDAVEHLLARAEKTGADIVAGTLHYKKNDGTFNDWKCELPYGKDALGVFKALLKSKFTHNLCGKLYRSSLLLKYEYVQHDKMTNAEDACLFYQLVENCNYVDMIHTVVYYYFQNSESSMNMRFTENQILNIITYNNTIKHFETKYATLQNDFHHSITASLVRLFLHGLPPKRIFRMIEEAGLADYITTRNILSTLSLREILYYIKVFFRGTF